MSESKTLSEYKKLYESDERFRALVKANIQVLETKDLDFEHLSAAAILARIHVEMKEILHDVLKPK